ncbi:5-oxoprolinase subunit C family protein [Portibacter lacus]|uniref:Biotin-dependent carboxyltransferase family protein n=1 Tax=Portibacter lacus TaxID=1099794 RepID=A0AA37SQM6_9BACT|nr:biotin-dependent carboxyltransferase family protein [Portibacter lacus]GLR18022.1 biotin-dependent carboxyltransferase family protein [Portibacter lacus]
MKGSLEILKPGLMTSIQGVGRKGLAYYAIPPSGAMDENAAQVALLLLGKNEEDPVLEFTSLAPEIKFHESTQIVITGADFNWKINNQSISLNTVMSVHNGDVLKGSFAKKGLRGYLAIKGKLDIGRVYHSYSTYANAKLGGFHGRFLKKGDVLYWSDDELDMDQVVPFYQGPEYAFLSDTAKDLLVSTVYKISPDTNRMGMRLVGERLESTSYQLENSVPVLPGFIQLPPNGQPIILLQDGQTTGGYPRIAYIKPAFLSKLNQFPLGSTIQLKKI